jgi:hypothetical protein
MTGEEGRLAEARTGSAVWKKWGPGLVAKLIQLYGLLDGKQFLESGKQGAFVPASQAT